VQIERNKCGRFEEYAAVNHRTGMETKDDKGVKLALFFLKKEDVKISV
jgi:hypothetical protein